MTHRIRTSGRLFQAASIVLSLGLVVPTPGGSRAATPAFVESSAEVGLVFTHVTGATGQYYLPEEMGAGVALFDYDSDGDLDAFLIQGGALGPAAASSSGSHLPAKAGSRGGGSRLFRNDLIDRGKHSQLRFTDVTDRARIDTSIYGMGVATGDYDGDGHPDLFLTGLGSDILYRNNGDGTFTDATSLAGVSGDRWSTSAAFVDYDRDGHLDLFVANYLDFSFAGNRRCVDPVGAPDYCSPRVYRPVPDRLYRNLGNGRFADVTESAGIAKADGAGLGVAAADYNRDGWPDLYVANDATPNQLWINRRDGTFADDGVLAGAAFNAAGNPEGSMGIASGDFDLDGDEDLLVTNLVGETFVLYENDGAGAFTDVRTRTGLAGPTASMTGFGTDWLDYDNDGWLDVFFANGAVNTIAAQRGQPRPFRMRNQLFRNLGGKRFEDASANAGPAFAEPDVGRGAAFGDVDNDGDIDIVVTSNGGRARLLLNQGTAGSHWLQIDLEQPGPNRLAIGAYVGVERTGRSTSLGTGPSTSLGTGPPTLWRRVRTDGSYLSASSPRLHFGLGASPAVDAVVVQWPDGQRERWTKPGADRVVTLKRGTGERQE
jgi:hypothetical protein